MVFFVCVCFLNLTVFWLVSYEGFLCGKKDEDCDKTEDTTPNIKSQNDHPYWLSLCNKCLHKAIKLWFSCNGKATSLFIAMHTVLQHQTSKDSIFFSNFKINDNHYRI